MILWVILLLFFVYGFFYEFGLLFRIFGLDVGFMYGDPVYLFSVAFFAVFFPYLYFEVFLHSLEKKKIVWYDYLIMPVMFGVVTSFIFFFFDLLYTVVVLGGDYMPGFVCANEGWISSLFSLSIPNVMCDLSVLYFLFFFVPYSIMYCALRMLIYSYMVTSGFEPSPLGMYIEDFYVNELIMFGVLNVVLVALILLVTNV